MGNNELVRGYTGNTPWRGPGVWSICKIMKSGVFQTENDAAAGSQHPRGSSSGYPPGQTRGRSADMAGMVRKRLFNCEVIALLTASYLVATGLQILGEVFLSTPEEKASATWEYYGFLLLALGLISGSIFWLIRRFLNKK